jgi:V/A-type H+-transporting ATPase subunit I
VRIALYGESSHKDKILSGLQDMGILHLIHHESSEDPSSSYRTTEAYEAYLFLRSSPEKRRQAHDTTPLDYVDVAKKVLSIRDRTLDLEDVLDSLQRRIKALAPWGEFDYRNLEKSGLRLWFYIVPVNEMNEIADSEFIWECVYRDNRFAYVVVVSEDEPVGIAVPRTHTGDKPLSWYQQKLDDVEEELEDLYWQRISNTKWLTLIARKLASAADTAALTRTAEAIWDDNSVFVVEAWAPERMLHHVDAFASGRGLIVTAKDPNPDDSPPTLLDNPVTWSGGQSLVHFYTTPGYSLWDPSRVVFSFFVLFFAMIIADAGYGLLLAILLLAFRRRILAADPGIYNLLKYLVIGTVSYGVLCGNYFGVSPPPESILASLQIIDVQDQNTMMGLSVVIGVTHLAVALGANVVLSPRGRLPLQNVGWLAILLGGLFFFIGYGLALHNFLLQGTGYFLMTAGAALVVAFSSQKPWRGASLKAKGLRLGEGLFALTGVSKMFGDVLSYLRLFALGLASAQLAITFNALAADAAESVSGAGMLLALLILCLGHGLNFLLALMSATVHGLRLNFIEFFNWGLAEEGTPFKPFAKRRVWLWNQL